MPGQHGLGSVVPRRPSDPMSVRMWHGSLAAYVINLAAVMTVAVLLSQHALARMPGRASDGRILADAAPSVFLIELTGAPLAIGLISLLAAKPPAGGGQRDHRGRLNRVRRARQRQSALGRRDVRRGLPLGKSVAYGLDARGAGFALRKRPRQPSLALPESAPAGGRGGHPSRAVSPHATQPGAAATDADVRPRGRTSRRP